MAYYLILKASVYDPDALAMFVMWNKRGADIWNCYTQTCDYDLKNLLHLIRSELPTSMTDDRAFADDGSQTFEQSYWASSS